MGLADFTRLQRQNRPRRSALGSDFLIEITNDSRLFDALAIKIKSSQMPVLKRQPVEDFWQGGHKDVLAGVLETQNEIPFTTKIDAQSEAYALFNLLVADRVEDLRIKFFLNAEKAPVNTEPTCTLIDTWVTLENVELDTESSTTMLNLTGTFNGHYMPTRQEFERILGEYANRNGRGNELTTYLDSVFQQAA